MASETNSRDIQACLTINKDSRYTVVFVNGLKNTSSYWNFNQHQKIGILDYAQTIATTLCFDLQLNHLILPIKDLTILIDNLLKEYGIRKPMIMVGHSYGGLITQMYANLYPNKVRGIILLDSSTTCDYFKARITKSYESNNHNKKYMEIYRSMIDNFDEIPAINIDKKIIVFSHINMKTDYSYAIDKFCDGDISKFYKNLQERLTYYKKISVNKSSRLQLHLDATHYIHHHEPQRIKDSINQMINLIR